MKANWMVAVAANAYENVLAQLAKKNITIINKMDKILVVLVEATEEVAASIRNINGVIAVEKEGEVTVQ